MTVRIVARRAPAFRVIGRTGCTSYDQDTRQLTRRPCLHACARPWGPPSLESAPRRRTKRSLMECTSRWRIAGLDMTHRPRRRRRHRRLPRGREVALHESGRRRIGASRARRPTALGPMIAFARISRWTRRRGARPGFVLSNACCTAVPSNLGPPELALRRRAQAPDATTSSIVIASTRRPRGWHRPHPKPSTARRCGRPCHAGRGSAGPRLAWHSGTARVGEHEPGPRPGRG
jgi:hypothetical protein